MLRLRVVFQMVGFRGGYNGGVGMLGGCSLRNHIDLRL